MGIDELDVAVNAELGLDVRVHGVSETHARLWVELTALNQEYHAFTRFVEPAAGNGISNGCDAVRLARLLH